VRVDILELTWFLAAAATPKTAATVMNTIGRLLPVALPVRFGPGDPPPEHAADNPGGFDAYWSGEFGKDWGGVVSWTGSGGAYQGFMRFPDRRHQQNAPGQAIGSLSLMLDLNTVRAAQATTEALFVELSDEIPAFYACGYVLQHWDVRRGVLSMNVYESETSPLPGGRVWIGIPPGAPLLSWFGPAYAPLVDGLLGDESLRSRIGLLHKASGTPDTPDDRATALPDELLAQRPEPRFWAVAPSVPAVVIPELS
jgi:hypothetical protein